SQPNSDQDSTSKLWNYMSLGISTINHIPKGARESCRDTLISTLDGVSSNPNDTQAWANLLAYAPTILYKPPRGVGMGNLTKTIKSRTVSFAGISDPMDHLSAHRPFHKHNSNDNIAKLVSSKIKSGNFSAVVRIACSDECLAPPTPENTRDKNK